MSDHIEEIRARVEKASCGPWKVIRNGEPDNDWLLASFGAASDDDRLVELHTDGVRGDGLSSAENDAEFCAHARTDIPDLLTALRALREENARLKVKSDALDRAHALLDRLDVPPAQGRVCDDPNCETHIEHRIHMLSDRRAALSSSPAQEPHGK